MPDNTPRIPDSIDLQRLSAMQLVAKMKESADKYGVGFVGGFISPNGEKFMMTNMSDEDTQMLLPDDLKWWSFSAPCYSLVQSFCPSTWFTTNGLKRIIDW